MYTYVYTCIVCIECGIVCLILKEVFLLLLRTNDSSSISLLEQILKKIILYDKACV